MDVEVRITNKYNGRVYVAGVIADDALFSTAYKPLRTTDSCACAIMTGDLLQQEDIAPIRKLRKDAADMLARELSQLIVASMEKDDTHNGENFN